MVGSGMIRFKRVYSPPEHEDGRRFLVERLWPRGVKRVELAIEDWCKAVAPSHALRRWFGHDPVKWAEFQRLYREELDENQYAWQPLLDAARDGTITLLYSARDSEHNSALVLRDYLEQQLAHTRHPRSAALQI